MLRRTTLARTLFDACYVLNLDRRTDRWMHVQAEMKKAHIHRFLKPGVTVERVPGVDGTQLDTAALRANGTLTETGFARLQLPTEEKLFGMDLTPGAIGCALGHRAVWEKVVASQNTCALILEDDVEFHFRFRRLLAERWSHVPADWGIVHFGGLDLLANTDGKPPRPFVAPGVRRAFHGQRELTAYVIHASAAARCLALSLPMTWQVDTHICSQTTLDAEAKDEYISDPMTYVLQPSLVIQVTSFGTDVQKTPAQNPALEDAARRMREFVGQGTSVR